MKLACLLYGHRYTENLVCDRCPNGYAWEHDYTWHLRIGPLHLTLEWR